MTARTGAGWSEEPSHRIVSDAFTIAGRAGTECRPVHLLQALAEVDGPIGEALQSLRLGSRERPGHSPGAGSTYIFGQTQGAAAQFAAARGEPMDAPHLMLALVDQDDTETMRMLAGAQVNTSELRKIALQMLCAPTDLPAIRIPPPTPAGTLDRPALNVADLDPSAWRVLSWRQDHLPLDQVRTKANVAALTSMEQRAVWRIADQAGVDDDQRYSLFSHHYDAVDQRVRATHPQLVEPRPQARHVTGVIYDQRFRRRRMVPSWMVGWPTWFGNRKRGIRNRWFRVHRPTRSCASVQNPGRIPPPAAPGHMTNPQPYSPPGSVTVHRSPNGQQI